MRYAGILSFYQNSGIDYREHGVQISAFNTSYAISMCVGYDFRGSSTTERVGQGCCSVTALL